ncbi:MAG: hypothetical protein H6Q33_1354 [Deltaproteobacteria bacterium]|jgi:hypothetical protein|nr:hypothetical protein [Deltaproteobacteria bacterium]
MPTPSRGQLEEWAKNYIALWNAGDKEAWVKNWKRIAAGDFRMLDPVGTPEKRGFEQCASGPFDLFQPKIRFNVVEGTQFICGNEVAWLLENHMSGDGRTVVNLSIETYRFGDDGSVVMRTYYRVPAQTDDEIGRMFKEYLPEGQ